MLSKNAFNALLKTLEEPPPHVKFVFATTEIHKVPVTVLSRCQRFSLRRVPVELLVEHYAGSPRPKAVEAEPAALALIARAADGSVRDGLSLLDQAIALDRRRGSRKRRCATCSASPIAACVFDLLESVLRGDAADALDRMDRLYQDGADPLLVLQDLLDLSHFLTRLKLAPEAGAGDPIAEGDRERARAAGREADDAGAGAGLADAAEGAGGGAGGARRRSRRRRWCWCASPMSPICRRRPSWSGRSPLRPLRQRRPATEASTREPHKRRATLAPPAEPLGGVGARVDGAAQRIGGGRAGRGRGARRVRRRRVRLEL